MLLRFSVLKICGYILMTLWIVLGGALFWHLIAEFKSYQSFLPKLTKGFGVTIVLVALSLAIGALVSLPIVFARLSSIKFLQTFASAYIYFFRGTPLLAQTFLLYYGAGSFREVLNDIGLWWFFRDAFNCVVFIFSLNTAAYQSEILYGAIQNVNPKQIEAGKSLGLPYPITFFKIILPQALLISWRPYGNEVILMIKGSAIASIVTVSDLMGETRRFFSRTYDYNAYILAALFYLASVEIIRRLWDKIETKIMIQHNR